jgi:hypothetical protein
MNLKINVATKSNFISDTHTTNITNIVTTNNRQ